MNIGGNHLVSLGLRKYLDIVPGKTKKSIGTCTGM
jgi:hypothetical protein